MLRATLGATLSVLIVSSLSLYLSDFAHTHHWLVASLAASALLIFLVPTSPLAQPWNIVLGNLVGALTGITCAVLLPHPIAAITMAVCVAMPIMLAHSVSSTNDAPQLVNGSGEVLIIKRVPGGKGDTVIEDAPGRYVKAKA